MDHYSESVTNFILRSLAMLAFLAVANVHANEIATLRQGIPLDKENIEPAKLGDPLNTDQKRSRAYPMQPPTIPHKIDGYQIDIKANKCMSCICSTDIGTILCNLNLTARSTTTFI